jgi:hypothetical protein
VSGLFYALSLPALGATLLAVFLSCVETGFRLGRNARARISTETHSLTGVLQSALLGLLALLLGFTFSMAASRHDFRQRMVADEANAIRTAFLTTRLLPEPRRAQAAGLLLRYLDARIAFLALEDPSDSPERGRAVEDLQRQLWATTEGLDALGPATTLLYAQGLEAVIVEQGRRAAAYYNRVPEAALAMLVTVAAASLALLGYGAGLGGRRSTICNLVSLLVVAVVLMIVDFDRPRSGLIIINEERLVVLRTELQRWSP